MKTKQKQHDNYGVDVRLLRSMAEELRLPLLQIARQAELANMGTVDGQPNIRVIEATSEAAIRLVDSYLFSTQVLLGQQSLPLEPTSVTATMYDTSQYLHKLAKIYDCDIDVAVRGKCGLVMANAKGLQAALTSLAYAFIGSSMRSGKQRIVLTATRQGQGIRAGVMTNASIEKTTLSKARMLYGKAHQPASSVTHKSGAGIYVADALFKSMESELQVVQQKSRSGLMATMLPSYQTALFN